MRIVVASNGLDIAPSFSQCENFNYYTTKSCEIVASQNIPAQGLSPEDNAVLMDRMDVTALICNEIGCIAKTALESHDIRVFDGRQGNALQAAEHLVEELACRIGENYEEEFDFPED